MGHFLKPLEGVARWLGCFLKAIFKAQSSDLPQPFLFGGKNRNTKKCIIVYTVNTCMDATTLIVVKILPHITITSWYNCWADSRKGERWVLLERGVRVGEE